MDSTKKPDAAPGTAYVRNTGYAVATLVEYKRLGADDATLLAAHPGLTIQDLHAAWAHANEHLTGDAPDPGSPPEPESPVTPVQGGGGLGVQSDMMRAIEKARWVLSGVNDAGRYVGVLLGEPNAADRRRALWFVDTDRARLMRRMGSAGGNDENDDLVFAVIFDREFEAVDTYHDRRGQ